MEEKKLIYCVDDEESIREVYSFALTGAGFRTECFPDGKSLFAATEKELPDLFILDIMLDGLDGYAILAELKEDPSTAEIPVIMVSAKDTEIDKVKGLNLGADDYMAKPFGVLELVARINAKLRRKETPKKIVYKDVTIDDETHTVSVGGAAVSATPKQYDLLKLLVLNAGKVLARDSLLDDVWGKNYGETRTLDIHIADLRRMLNSSEAEIVTVRGVGYSLK